MKRGARSGRLELGLIGKPVSHSFSPAFFEQLWAHSSRNFQKQAWRYRPFELDRIDDLPALIRSENLFGFNVTIPYKESILESLSYIDRRASEMGAVNTVFVARSGLYGFNTDWLGFLNALEEFCEGSSMPGSALILGSGGASKAVAFALKELNIPFSTVSRSGELKYGDLSGRLTEWEIIINTSPLGTYPHIRECPDIPFDELSPSQKIFDLVYNPKETFLMREAGLRGLKTTNGYRMLEFQALEAWRIWKTLSEF